VKSLYYCRSLSIQRAEKDNGNTAAIQEPVVQAPVESNDYEECLSCQ
jgi:ribonucleoside-diphosphate reductase alpha chain